MMETLRYEFDREELFKLVEQLVSIPSTMLDGDDIYLFALKYLQEAGLDVQQQDYSGMYPMVMFNKPPNIVARLSYSDNSHSPPSGTIHLNCHLDTVMPSIGWQTDPYSPIREGNKLLGLGACDMKGGAAALLYTMKLLAKTESQLEGNVDSHADRRLKRNIVLSCVSGEEAPYSLGTDALIKMNDLSRTDLVIIPEPSPVLAMNDHCLVHHKKHSSCFPNIIVGAAGRRIYRITFHGKSAHASHPDRGINALEEAAKTITSLKDFNLFSTIKTGSGHYCVLQMEGGDESFTVPGECSILLTRQMVVGERERDIKKEIQQVISGLRLRSKVRVEKRFSPLPELEYDPYVCEGGGEMQRFIEMVESWSQKKQCRFITRSVGDFNYFGSRLKAPTLVFGPGGSNIHAPGECVQLDHVEATARLLLRFLTE